MSADIPVENLPGSLWMGSLADRAKTVDETVETRPITLWKALPHRQRADQRPQMILRRALVPQERIEINVLVAALMGSAPAVRPFVIDEDAAGLGVTGEIIPVLIAHPEIGGAEGLSQN